MAAAVSPEIRQLVQALIASGALPLIDVYAISELPDQTRNNWRREAAGAVLERMLTLKVVGTPEEAIIHMIYPDADLNAGAVAYEQWLTAALVAATAYTFVNLTLAVHKCLAIYGCWENDANPTITEVRLAKGPGGRNTLGTFNVQRLRTKLEGPEGYFSTISLWDRAETIFVSLMPNITNAAGVEFGLFGYVGEPVSEQVAGPIL